MAQSRRPPGETPVEQSPAKLERPPRRRGFMTKAAAVIVGGLVSIVPIAAAAVTFLDPLFRKRKDATAGAGGTSTEAAEADGFLRVTNTQSLSNDGTPRMFAVVADLQDAWNKFPNTEIGSVYLWQAADGKIECFNARCPHLGCTVNYKADVSAYACPCHDSAFSEAGVRTNDIPPRNMDPLEAEIRNTDEVWVRFQKFRCGIHERVPV